MEAVLANILDAGQTNNPMPDITEQISCQGLCDVGKPLWSNVLRGMYCRERLFGELLNRERQTAGGCQSGRVASPGGVQLTADSDSSQVPHPADISGCQRLNPVEVPLFQGGLFHQRTPQPDGAGSGFHKRLQRVEIHTASREQPHLR